MIGPGITYLTRGGWGARTDLPRLGHPVAKGQRVHSIFHHTVIIDDDATANLWENLTEVIAKMRQLQTIRPDLGLDVPYNFVIFLMAGGTIIVCEGRGIALTGAHTYGHNTDGIGTALQGNFQLPISVSPYASLISRYLGWLKYDQRLESLGPIEGHRDFRDPDDPSTWTACPGDNLYVVLGQLTYAKEDNVLNDDDKAYLGALMRGHLEELWSGHANDPMKLGDPNWKPPMTLKDMMDKLAAVERTVDALKAGSGLTYDEAVEADKEAHRQGTG